jgi:hypothetical protein
VVGEDGLVVIDSEAQTESERWVEGWHGLLSGTTTGRDACRSRRKAPRPILSGMAYLPALALAASHFAWVISTKPWPLQEF